MAIYKNKDIQANINERGVELGNINVNFYTEDNGTASIRIKMRNQQGVPINFNNTDMQPRLDLYAKDGSIFTNEPVDIILPEQGLIQYKVPDYVIRHEGKMDCKLFLENGTESVHVANFYFVIKDSGVTGSVGKEIKVDILQDMVRDVMSENAMGLLDDEYKDKINQDVVEYISSNPDKYKGPKGDKGEIGPQGQRGLKGDTGEQGLQGPRGLQGMQGERGLRGEQGLKGDKGEQGPKGDTGSNGIKGEKGDKGDKGDTLKYADLSTSEKEDLKSNITDQAVTDFVLKNGTVTTSKLDSNAVGMEKTDFLKTGKNIFRANNVTLGKVVSPTTGQLSDSQYFVASDFEPVKPGATYTQNYGEPIAFYDIERKYISGIAGAGGTNVPRTFTVPSNAYYIRTTTSNVGVSTYNYKGYQIELGTTSTEYESFYQQIKDLKTEIPNDTIKSDHIQNGAVSLEKLSVIRTSQNIFDKSKAIVGYYVNPTTGALSANANYYYSDYINVSDETKVTKSTASNLYAFYDANKNFIANTNTNTKTIEVPTKAVYLRITVPKANIESEMLVKGEVLPSKYIPYKLFIPNDYLETVSEDVQIPEYYGKQNLKKYIADISKQINPNATTRAEIAVIGDSWVQGGEFGAGDRLTLPLRNKMKEIYSDGGIGFVGFANNHVGNGEVSVTLNGSWTHYDEGLDNIAQSKGIDSAMVESSTVGDTIKVQFNEDTDFYEIHTLNTGKWKYNIDGGEWTEVDASTQEVTTLNYPLGKHIINIEIVSGTVTFIGSYSYKGEKGVVIHKVGNGGLRAGHIASTDRSNWIKQLQRCRANTYAILLGTNDMAQNITLSDFERDIKEVVSRVKEAKPLSSIILIAPSGNKYDGSRNNTMLDFSDVLLKISKDLEISYVSLYRTLGDFATTNANGLMYSDGVHPNRDGGYAISNVIYDRLLRI